MRNEGQNNAGIKLVTQTSIGYEFKLSLSSTKALINACFTLPILSLLGGFSSWGIL